MIKKVVLTAILVKVFIFAIIFIAYNLLPFATYTYYANFHFPFNGPVTLQTAFSTWDAQHYLFLAQYGYRLGFESDRFYPLFPGLIHLFSLFFGVFLSGLFVSNVMSIIGFIYFYLFVRDFTKDEHTAFLSFLLLLFFPTGFYFSLVYSEGLFLGIVAPLFYYLYKKKYLLAFVLSFLLPLVRPTGILIVPALFIYAFFDYIQLPIKNLKQILKSILRVRPSIIVTLTPFIGYAIYLLIMYASTGNAFTGINYANNVVGGWRIDSLWHPLIFLHNLFDTHLALHGFTNSLIDRVFFVLFLLSLPLVWRKTDIILFVYALSMGLVPLFGNFMSYTRYSLLAIPVFIALAIVLKNKKYEYFKFPIFYLMIAIQTLFLIMQALNFWVA